VYEKALNRIRDGSRPLRHKDKRAEDLVDKIAFIKRKIQELETGLPSTAATIIQTTVGQLPLNEAESSNFQAVDVKREHIEMAISLGGEGSTQNPISILDDAMPGSVADRILRIPCDSL